MPVELHFHGWMRSSIYQLPAPSGEPELVDGRLQREIELTLSDEVSGASDTRTVPLQILGPPDAPGLPPGQLLRRMPPPNSDGTETNLCTHVDFKDPDFPWRYTPQNHSVDRLRPWIALVVGRVGDDQELQFEDGRVVLGPNARAAYPLGQSAAWAHVQTQADGSQAFSRLLSYRLLDPDVEYIACVVPTFDADGQDAWSASTSPPLPIYDQWRFRTAVSGGDFKTLAEQLAPSLGPDGLGEAPLIYDRVAPSHELLARGSLAPIAPTASPLPDVVRNDLTTLQQLPADPLGRTVLGLPPLGEPWVGAPATRVWGVEANQDPRHRGAAGLGAWCGIVHQDLLSRAVSDQAGALEIAAQRIRSLTLGLRASRALWQRRLPSTVAGRLLLFGPSLRRMMTPQGSVRDQVTGGERPLPRHVFSGAARRVFRRNTARTRFARPGAAAPTPLLGLANTCPPPPERAPDGLPHVDDLGQRLGLPPLEKVLREALADGRMPERPAIDLVNRARRIVQNLEGGAQLLRALEQVLVLPNGGQPPLGGPGVGGRPTTAPPGRFGPGRIPFAGSPRPPRRWPRGTRPRGRAPAIEPGGAQPTVTAGIPGQLLVEIVSPFAATPTVRGLLGRIRAFPQLTHDDARSLLALAEIAVNEPPRRPCRPVDLNTLDAIITAAVDPTADDALAVVRVTSTIGGLVTPPLVRPEICPELDFQAWTILRDHALEWLLPGVSDLQVHDVVAVATNPAFEESLLIGLNMQLLAEMRWRDIPIRTSCTPLRRFWGRIDPVTELIENDILGIRDWTDTPLGDPGHRPPAAAGPDLVLVIKSDLFRRYPQTLVYAAPAVLANGQPDWETDPNWTQNDTFKYPVFQGDAGEDISFFGFDMDPPDARGYWFILEEVPTGYRFRSDRPVPNMTTVDGGQFAHETFNDPVRVLIRGETLIPEP